MSSDQVSLDDIIIGQNSEWLERKKLLSSDLDVFRIGSFENGEIILNFLKNRHFRKT